MTDGIGVRAPGAAGLMTRMLQSKAGAAAQAGPTQRRALNQDLLGGLAEPAGGLRTQARSDPEAQAAVTCVIPGAAAALQPRGCDCMAKPARPADLASKGLQGAGKQALEGMQAKKQAADPMKAKKAVTDAMKGVKKSPIQGSGGGGDRQADSLKLQQTQNRKQQLLDTMTNILKTHHDQAMSMIRNIK